MTQKNQLGLWLIAGMAAVVAVFALALAVAPDGLGWSALLGDHGEGPQRFVLKVTVPRILLAFAVGAGLAMCGAALQGMLRNPLADPYVLGVSGGAAVGAVFFSSLGWFAGASLWGARMGGALVGSALTTLFLLRVVFSRPRPDSNRVILLGVSLNIFAGAVITMVHALANPNDSVSLLFWLMGDLTMLDPTLWYLAPLAVALVVLLGLVLTRNSGKLNLLSLGTEGAQAAGVDPGRLLRLVLICTAIIAAMSSAMVGLIGFVGLIVPHLVRLVVGSDQRWVIPLSGIVGAVGLALCDLSTRVLRDPLGTELPVGAITALLGAPILIFLVLREARRHD